jgi:predicted DNA-binding transcriptional regulator YafY
MRADRLLSILLLLQSRGRMTGRELAKRLEVSERTVHRDMDALSAAGVPVFALRGSQGGWQLDEKWRTQVPGLDESELRAFLMVQPRVVGDQRLAAAAERALDKLMASLPASMREQAASMRQRLYVDTAGWHGTSEDLSLLPVVQNAVSRDRKLKIRYRKADYRSGETASSERIVDPLGLVAKGNTWYLVAQTSNGLRTFRVSRMQEAVLLERASERPADFDLRAYWKNSTEQFTEARTRFSAILRMSPSAARGVRMWRIASALENDKSADPEGWESLRVQFENEEEACFVVLGFGPRVEVIGPQTLKDRVLENVAQLVERHRARAMP